MALCRFPLCSDSVHDCGVLHRYYGMDFWLPGAGADGQAQIKGDDVGWGYNLSAMYEVNENHQIGLVYKSHVELDYTGKVHLNALSNTGTTPFAAIFGGSQGWDGY